MIEQELHGDHHHQRSEMITEDDPRLASIINQRNMKHIYFQKQAKREEEGRCTPICQLLEKCPASFIGFLAAACRSD